jgi:hypothetical protein
MNLLNKFRLFLFMLLSITAVVVIILSLSIYRYYKTNEIALRDVNPENLTQAFREIELESSLPKPLISMFRKVTGGLMQKLSAAWPKIKPYLEFAGIFTSGKEGSLMAPKGQAEEKAKDFQEKYDNRYQAVVDLIDE